MAAPPTSLGLDPRSCFFGISRPGVWCPGSHLADHQTLRRSKSRSQIPFTGHLAPISAQFREPWQLNLGACNSLMTFTPRITLTLAMANVFNGCFRWFVRTLDRGISTQCIDCAYAANAAYLGWSPGEAWKTAGAGYFYASNPHAPVENGTAGYPKLFDQAYEPGPVQVASPLQAFIQAQIRL